MCTGCPENAPLGGGHPFPASQHGHEGEASVPSSCIAVASTSLLCVSEVDALVCASKGTPAAAEGPPQFEKLAARPLSLGSGAGPWG